MQGTGPAKIIDAAKNIKLDPKPVTELDRLAFVVKHLSNNAAIPKGSAKKVPTGDVVENEGFTGLTKE